MLNKAHDAAINKGAAITTKRVSISKNPFEICKFNTLYIIVYYLLNSTAFFVQEKFLQQILGNSLIILKLITFKNDSCFEFKLDT